MGRELAATFPIARRVFDEADQRLGFALSGLCFEGPADRLELTEHAQPAILTASVAAYRVLAAETGVRPVALAGHSLGEWSALVVAGVLSLGDAVGGVRERGRLMQSAVPVGEGAMAALVGVTTEVASALCAEVADGDVLTPANLNGGGQVVVSGTTRAVDRLVAAAGGRRIRAQKLAVSAPFHCALMAPAADGLARHLENVTVNDPTIPIVTSVDARAVRDAADVRELLVRQVTAPVRWEDAARALVALGPTVAIETGPGRILAGLMKRIAPELPVVVAFEIDSHAST